MAAVGNLEELSSAPDIELLQKQAAESIDKKLDIRASSLGNMTSVLEHAAQRAEESQTRLAESERRVSVLLHEAHKSVHEMSSDAHELVEEAEFIQNELMRGQQQASQEVYDQLTGLLAWRDTLSGTYTVLSSLADVEAHCETLLAATNVADVKAVYLQVADLCHSLAGAFSEQASLVPIIEISVAMVKNAWEQVLLKWQFLLSDELSVSGWPRHVPSFEGGFKDVIGDLFEMDLCARRNPLPGVSFEPSSSRDIQKYALSTPNANDALKPAANASSPQSTSLKYNLTPPEGLKPLVDPLVLRFKYAFEGDRPSNRLDKPELAFDFALEQIRAHIGYIMDTVQPIANSRGFETDCAAHFITLLLQPVIERSVRHANQLADAHMDREFTHLIDQLLLFDADLKAMGYFGPIDQVAPPPDQDATGAGDAADVHAYATTRILEDPSLFDHWIAVEHLASLGNLDASLAEPDIWAPVPSHRETLFPGAMHSTWPAQRLADLAQQMIVRLSQLPQRLAKRYFHDIFFEAIRHFREYLTSVHDVASASWSSMPSGSLEISRQQTPLDSITRLAAIYGTALWVRDKSSEWSDEPAVICITGDVDPLSQLRREFGDISKHAMDSLVQRVTSAMLDELQAYIKHPWNTPSPDNAPVFDSALDISNEIAHAANLWQQIWSRALDFVPALAAQIWYDRVAIQLGEALYTRFVLQCVWSYAGARQALFDWHYGIVARAESIGIPQPERGWRVLLSALLIVSLPPGDLDDQHANTFPEVLAVAYDPNTPADPTYFRQMMDHLHVPSSYEPVHVQALLKRRPEAWHY